MLIVLLLLLHFVIYLLGVHLIASSGVRVSYVYYNLNTLKVERECLFPAETQALLGRSDYRVTLHSCAEVFFYT